MKREHVEKLIEAVDTLTANYQVGPDPRMGGATDCYMIPLDDVENLVLAAQYVRRDLAGEPGEVPRVCGADVAEGEHGGVFQPTACGCKVTGEGNLPSPIAIAFCELHQGAGEVRRIADGALNLIDCGALSRGGDHLGAVRSKWRGDLRGRLQALDKALGRSPAGEGLTR